MRRVFLAPALTFISMTVFVLGSPVAASAECSVILEPFPYSDSALHNRDVFLAAVCGGAKGDIYSASDPALKDRLQRVPGSHPVHGNPYSEAAERRHLEGDLVVAYVVETDGSIKYAAVIESTGQALLDEPAIDWLKKQSMKPFTLDGQPIRVFDYLPIKFRIRPSKP
jgi:TonB family protein